MLNLDQFMDIRFLQKQGHSVREIARLTGHSRNTVRKMLRADGSPRPTRRECKSILDPFKDYLRQRWQEHGLSSVRLHQEIVALGFLGCSKLVSRFIARLRRSIQVSQRLTVRFETPPGEQAQCDWAEVGRFAMPDGIMARVYAFVMVLSFSRYMYIEFTRSMRVDVLIRCHQSAFAFFGGWPKRILYDNMRQVVIRPDRVNPRFNDFARYYGFEVKRHRPYRPRTKGKVERMVGYVRGNFLNGRSFAGMEDLNGQGRQWLGSVANVRVHATTGARPCDLLLEEPLTPIAGQQPYHLIHSVTRRVGAEALVRFERSDYSVPAGLVGQQVYVDASAGRILIRTKDLVVAEHERAKEAGQRVEAPVHVRERWQRSLEARPAPPKGCHITFAEEVQVRPLAVYAEVSS